MKRIIFFVCLFLLTLSSYTQTRFIVPPLTDLQKFQNAAIQWNGSFLTQISYAKSLGKSVEDVAGYVGDQLKVTWNKSGGYEGFVQGMFFMMLSLVPYGSVEIIDQTANSITFKVDGLYSELKEEGSMFNVTYTEYLRFLDKVISKVAAYMGADYSQKDTETGLIATIKRL